ncbi:hypothetical protein X809_02795 [Paenibacillus polymyxa CR1]|nr:hypothetical protein X809_02795 [Paenibacillus polymyxa CR1]
MTDFLVFQEHIAQVDAASALAIGWHMSTVLHLGTVRPWRTTEFEFLCKEILGRNTLINRAVKQCRSFNRLIMVRYHHN